MGGRVSRAWGGDDGAGSQRPNGGGKDSGFVLWEFLWPVAAIPMLAVADLTKSFLSPEGERVEIVNVPGFNLAAGDQVALRGESGSG